MTPSDLVSHIDARLLMRRLGNEVTEHAILVGGQAVAVWAEYFRAETGIDAAVLGSRDTDFCATIATVRIAAKRLVGKLSEPTIDDANTPTVGVVDYVDERGNERWIDFIDQPHGLTSAAIHKRKQTLELLDEQDKPTGQSFHILHPLDLLKSRVWNTGGLPGYQTPHAFRQLKAAIACARAFARTVMNAPDLSEKDAHRAVLRMNEEVFDLAATPYGLDVFFKFGIDVSEATLEDPRLPEKFREVRLPQRRAELADLRKRKAPKP
ncbi:MAG: hypothetical protein JST92_25140 [Deltaproteobacteria bacterium]|nr:hypothetical protein [Deltaproteobacteria bacterium]